MSSSTSVPRWRWTAPTSRSTYSSTLGAVSDGHVADAQSAAKVVDVEALEPRQRGDRLLELLDVEDLRADVGVKAAQVEHRLAADPLDRVGDLVTGDAELGCVVPGGHLRVGLGLDGGADPQQHRYRFGGQSALSATTSSRLSTTM